MSAEDDAMEEERRKARVAIEERAVQELREHMTLEDTREDRRGRWHTVKEIPVALIATLVAQTLGGAALVGAFAANVSAKFDASEKASSTALIVQATVDHRQDEDQRRAEDRIMAELRDIKMQLVRMAETKPK